MPLPTFAPSIAPSPGATHKPEIKILAADFGDGYSQPAPDGFNHIRKVVSLNWDTLGVADMTAIRSFFEGRRGTDPFYYQPYGEPAPVKWTCAEWEVENGQGY